ncbi:MAG: FAD-dependent oxidoreductase [Candidatus Accumulibacter phosphatis]|uniref:FAD-dependent oxidoreductase n=3 Tax=Candidatus Accumulibacter TaxID=327159 RepID=A0A7D5SBJ8_9PROT|nr:MULTISPECIES: FAD-dependent oxidoreductase [Candidatus Accumulibacter]QLH48779.1 MAG: FAD-dependent oxidoreductase [Candidatus Accumulibacter cognatus]MCC2866841.1 FAD-dependent oxidoreductase [Candidatus Accumulibacter phosphatis]MCQ1547648.1 FAD-dependent oxidoreductase [Candidatus Accumulibacter phosphatis]TMQ78038.1 Amine oxidase, flavin-containing [Candidatus Accumulibacter phosphatis]HRD89336.1 FAD-dependent oxidoreductase [Accumulibacter sp.]
MYRPPAAQRIAVVGAGISGLASAWLLSQKHAVTLYEAGDYLGGHTHTVDVTLDGVCHPVDTGFLVYNTHTYPNLTALFAHLGVASVETEMSFAVSLEEPGIEWAGSSLATVFGQKRNLLRGDFWRMLADILRFNRDSIAWIEQYPDYGGSLREFLAAGRYSRPFAEWYLLPMAAAIWSCPAGQMLDYPLASFVRFCRNHGLLQVFDRPLWRTVKGGGREYVRKLASRLADIRLGTPVRGVRRTDAGLQVITDGAVACYDQVVLACHSDQALVLLAEAATPAERRLLGAIRYEPNRAVLHSDAALLPRKRALWSAWNYLSSAQELDRRPVSVSYLINRLQPLPFKTPLMVSLNPQREPKAESVIAEFDYEHPIFDGPAIAAQRELPALSGRHSVWFCGAWNGYGFHEDGLKSALQVANGLGCQAPWQGGEAAASPAPVCRQTTELAA